MLIRESLMVALSSIYSHKLRSVLTMLGIIIGVASVIAIVAIGEGGGASLKTLFVGNGNNTIEVMYQSLDENGNMSSDPLSDPKFKESDILTIEKIPEVQRVIANISTSAKLNYMEHTFMVQLEGITEPYFEIFPTELLAGRNIAFREFAQARKVALISEELLKKIGIDDSIIGGIIELEGTSFKVVGVFNEQNSILNTGSYHVLIPREVWPSLFGESKIDSLTIQAQNSDALETVGDAAVKVLNSSNEDSTQAGEYFVLDIKGIQNSISSITRIMTAIIGTVAGISLFVGGVGVMNIMLVSVTERTKEIGIRKALGATRNNILIQFLIESIVLTTVGGVVGIGLGISAAKMVSLITSWPFVIPIYVVIGGVLFSMIIGVVFGMLPANRASKWEPMDSLLHEI